MSCILAVDGGGTRTRAGLYTPEGELLAETETEATNPVPAPVPVPCSWQRLGTPGAR